MKLDNKNRISIEKALEVYDNGRILHEEETQATFKGKETWPVLKFSISYKENLYYIFAKMPNKNGEFEIFCGFIDPEARQIAVDFINTLQQMEKEYEKQVSNSKPLTMAELQELNGLMKELGASITEMGVMVPPTEEDEKVDRMLDLINRKVLHEAKQKQFN
jgi:hypothetical protein